MAIMLMQNMLGQVNKIKWYSEHVRESQYLLQIVINVEIQNAVEQEVAYLDY
ncbi:unnamed protein product [Acanthoscelides obtectus]|uniref:Uncharacterized protein n=1 Tax=Acanthoscelides obtectus TaxID=200917 RepID=A0A9P0P2P1_ACAOB|nr:unnamed protein product [Acanthoscelides obtectus]CAK1666612.1 hypothetical protein AOBTE_LOCUS25396 [Acanthoscelides obtectus]